MPSQTCLLCQETVHITYNEGKVLRPLQGLFFCEECWTYYKDDIMELDIVKTFQNSLRRQQEYVE